MAEGETKRESGAASSGPEVFGNEVDLEPGGREDGGNDGGAVPPPGAGGETSALGDEEAAAADAGGAATAADEVEIVVLDDLPDEGDEAGTTTPPAEADGAPKTGTGDAFWADLSAFYLREAAALTDRQAERAALMFLDAAAADELGSASGEEIRTRLEDALLLGSASDWLLSLIRRALLRLRRFDRALEIGRREVALGGENAVRAAVLQESAAIVRHHLGDRARALGLLEDALAVDPKNVISLVSTASLRLALERWGPAAEALETLSSLLSVPEERSLYLYAAGNLREGRLDQPDLAEDDYRRALEHDRQNLAAAQALSHILERRSQWAKLCGSLEHLAELAPNRDAEGRWLYQAGSLHLDDTRSLEAAARDLARAAEATPDEPLYWQRLAYAYQAMGHDKEVVSTLRRLLALTLDAQSRAAILSQIGAISQSRLGQIEAAIDAYREALEAVEGYLPALQALGTLYRQLGDYESLLAIYAPEVEGALPAKVRAVRCVEMAEILADHLGRPDEAVVYYQRALDLDPDLLVAAWGLRRLLRQLNRHDELAELLARLAARSRDVRSATQLLIELAHLRAGPLAQVGRAIETLAPIGDHYPARAAAVALIDLYEASGRHDELVRFLLDQAQDTEDFNEVQGRRLQAAQVLEFQLDEGDRALAIYREVLKADPLCAMAIRGAGRIYHRLGRWSDLVDLHFHELESVPERRDGPMLLYRIGRIQEEKLGRVGEAIKAYSAALEKDPSYAPALTALEQLVRAERRWPELVEVLEKHAAARADHALAARALCRAAEVCDTQLEDLHQAKRLYLLALERSPGLALARHGLLRVRRRLAEWDQVTAQLRELIAASDGQEEASQLTLELARTLEYRLHRAPDLELYVKGSAGSRFGDRLRLEVTRILRLDQTPDRAVWLRRLGTDCADPALSVAYLLESAQLDELGAEGRYGLEAAEQAHQRQPDWLPVIWSLERALVAHRQWAKLGVLAEREAQLELDPSMRVIRLARAALAYLRADRGEEAGRVARKCLNFDAHSLAALSVLARLAEDGRDWKRLAELSDRLAEASRHPENRLASCLSAADLWSDRVGERRRALASLSVVLTADPGQPETFARAERLHRAGREYGELSSLYRWRIKACDDDAEKVELLRQHARLLAEDLADVNGAVAELSALLSIAPADEAALSQLSDLLTAQERWSDAAETLGTLVERAKDPARRRAARLRQAALYLRHLHEPGRARQVLTAQLSASPDDVRACKLMAELCTSEGSWQEARTLLEALYEDANPEVRAWAVVQLAEVARLGLRDEALSERYALMALELVADEPKALSSLAEPFWTHQPAERLIENAERILDEQPFALGANQLRTLAARLLLDELDEPARAIDHLRRAALEEEADRQVGLLLGRALERENDLSGAMREYRKLLAASPDCVEAYRGLVRVSGQSGQPETAAAAAALIDLLDTMDPKEATLLRGYEKAHFPKGTLALSAADLPEAIRPLQKVLDLAYPYLDAVYPTYLREVIDEAHPAAAACVPIARALSLGKVVVSLNLPHAVCSKAGLGEPVPLMLAPELATQPGDPSFRFWVGRALYRAASHSALLDVLEPEDLVELLEALTHDRPSTPTGRQLRKQLGRILPRKLRKRLDAQALDTSLDRVASYCRWQDARSDEVALLFCRHPKIAVEEVARVDEIPDAAWLSSQRIRALTTYAVSDDYARQSRALWL